MGMWMTLRGRGCFGRREWSGGKPRASGAKWLLHNWRVEDTGQVPMEGNEGGMQLVGGKEGVSSQQKQTAPLPPSATTAASQSRLRHSQGTVASNFSVSKLALFRRKKVPCARASAREVVAWAPCCARSSAPTERCPTTRRSAPLPPSLPPWLAGWLWLSLSPLHSPPTASHQASAMLFIYYSDRSTWIQQTDIWNSQSVDALCSVWTMDGV